jgi:hypothetical protein
MCNVRHYQEPEFVSRLTVKELDVYSPAHFSEGQWDRQLSHFPFSRVNDCRQEGRNLRTRGE